MSLFAQATDLAFSTVRRWTGQKPPRKGHPALVELNGLMGEHYNLAKQDALKKLTGPIIFASATEISIQFEGRREPIFSFYDETTANLKCMAHVTMSIALIAGPYANPKDTTDSSDFVILPPPQRKTLADYHTTLKQARKVLDAADLTPPQRERQKRLMEGSDAALKALTSAKGMPRTEYETFLKESHSIAMFNVEDATERMLAGLNAHIMGLRDKFGPASWKDLRVIVSGPHMPRSGFLTSQYFEKLLYGAGDNSLHACDGGCSFGVDREDILEDGAPRMLFMESYNRLDPDAGLSFLATHLVDARMGRAFFGDPRRLHRDVLADATAKQLEGMELPRCP